MILWAILGSVAISQLVLYIMFRKELKGDKNGN